MTFSNQPAIRFAIVGCGRIANRHAEHVGKFGKLVATCDPERDRAEKMAAPHGAQVFDSLEAMLAITSDIDVVSVCSPNGLHAQHAIVALQAGCHVLC